MEKLRLFNPDILELVLSKLQTKDLLRMKFVSKSWRDIIRDRSFALRHSRLRLPPVSGFLFQKNLEWEGLGVSAVSYISAERKEEEEPPMLLSNIVDSMPADFKMVSSCNGLICCTRYSAENDTLAIRVGNPLTREWFECDWKRCGGRAFAIGLTFNPCRDLTNNSTNFKLVLVQEAVASIGKACFGFYVYSSETGTWRLLDVDVSGDDRFTMGDTKCVSVKGFLYWSTVSGILVFDVENELAYVILRPIMPIVERDQSYGASVAIMGESDGKLQYVMVSSARLVIWALEDPQDGGKWSLVVDKFFADMQNDLVRFLCLQREERSFSMWGFPFGFKDGFMVLRVSSDTRNKGAIYLLNTRDGGFSRFADATGFSIMGGITPCDVLPYSMSLVPLNRP
ncbi:unnamed protein product [Linum trigynum]|uniref:F-box domain-containing protein n=1 Tax=Linum trigynum TaxID=586398 RepID=A0AAV2DG12_9ROSI